MLIRVGYEMEFEFQAATPMLAMLNVHPSRTLDLIEPDEMETRPGIPLTHYHDDFGNRCTRFVAPKGRLQLSCSALVLDNGRPDPLNLSAQQCPVGDLPADTLMFLLSSRYCEVDRLGEIAQELFGRTQTGWARVQAICDWVHAHVRFDYAAARPTKTALDVFTERVGVCRDFQHLAITLCRAMNIPARYATGYLGDIGVPPGGPMDFSAWFQVYLDNRWWTFDARHNTPRIGRVLMAVGRDAADVALTTSFGQADLKSFFVVTEEEAKRPGVVEEKAKMPMALAG